MSHTAPSAEASSPAPGWYADPGDSGGQRWWSGIGWTESVQIPARPAQAPPPAAVAGPAAAEAKHGPAPAVAFSGNATVRTQVAGPTAGSSHFGSASAGAAPVSADAFVPFTPVAPAQPTSGVSRFGGPIAHATVPTAVAVPASHRSAAAPEPALSRAMMVGLGAALVASLTIGVFVWSRSSGTTAAPDTSGPRGPASVAAAKLDALSLASSEETFYADHQKYLAIASTPGVIALGSAVVHLSPTDSASVVVDPAGVGYCISVVSRSATSSASSTVVYVSTAGGLQPNVVTSCPATF